jgi:hypothetical protein
VPATHHSNAGDAANKQPGSAASVVAALQQLGHSCGESVMAADLAAFVTHKQLHASHAAVAQEHNKQDTAAGEEVQICLPSELRSHAALLWCMHAVQGAH